MNEIQLTDHLVAHISAGKRLRPLSSQNLRRRQLQRLPVRHEPQTSQTQVREVRET